VDIGFIDDVGGSPANLPGKFRMARLLRGPRPAEETLRKRQPLLRLLPFHPRLIELSAHYHFAPRPCQVRAGNQKGRVERVIRYVRDSFWAARTFTIQACL
jgi:hypothetical protein